MRPRGPLAHNNALYSASWGNMLAELVVTARQLYLPPAGSYFCLQEAFYPASQRQSDSESVSPSFLCFPGAADSAF